MTVPGHLTGSAVIRSPSIPTEGDVRALREFLNSTDAVSSERALQELLKKHPAIIGILGFVEFIVEPSLRKRDSEGQIVHDGRRKDRPDLVVAKESPIWRPGKPYKSAHLFELKAATATIASRDH